MCTRRVRRLTAKNKNCEFCTINSAQLLENLTPFTQLCHACFCKVKTVALCALVFLYGALLIANLSFNSPNTGSQKSGGALLSAQIIFGASSCPTSRDCSLAAMPHLPGGVGGGGALGRALAGGQLELRRRLVIFVFASVAS